MSDSVLNPWPSTVQGIPSVGEELTTAAIKAERNSVLASSACQGGRHDINVAAAPSVAAMLLYFHVLLVRPCSSICFSCCVTICKTAAVFNLRAGLRQAGGKGSVSTGGKWFLLPL